LLSILPSMQQKHSSDPVSAPPSYRRLMVALVLSAVFVISSMVYTATLSGHIKSHAQTKDIANHIELEMVSAHLWLEESVSGNANIEERKIEPLLENIRADFQQLKKSPIHTHTFLAHPEMDNLPKLITQVEYIFEKLEFSTHQRLKYKNSFGTGSESDEVYDALFMSFNTEMASIHNILQSSLQKHLSNLRMLEIAAATLSVFIFFYTIALILTFLRQQKKYFVQQLEHEKAQSALKNQYQNLIEQSPFGIQIMSPDGKIQHVNQAWENLWQTSKNKLGDYNLFQDTLVQESSVFDDIKRGFSGKQVVTSVVNFNLSDTKENHSPFNNHYVRVHIYPVKNATGDIEQIIMFYADVTETHLQHAFQFGQNEILEKIANPHTSLTDTLTQLILFIERLAPHMIGSILLLDEDGSHLINGIGPHLPQGYLDTIEGMDIGPVAGSCGTAAYTKKRVVVADISTNPLWENFKDLALDYNLQACWSQPILDSDYNVLGTFALYCKQTREISKEDIDLIKRAAILARNAILHKRSMQNIIASEKSLKEAQKLAHIGYWELDIESGSLRWSDEVFRIFEIDKQKFDASYEAFLSAIHPDDRDDVNLAYTTSLDTHKPYDIKHRLLMPDGRIKHVRECCETFFDLHGQPYKSIGTIQDITKTVEEQLEKESLQGKMEHVQRLESLGVLAGGIAHDFNNILTAILGNAGLAQSKLPATSPINSYIGNITQASQKAADLCKQMLAYSGKGQFIIKPILLSELVEELSQLLHVTIAKNVVLRLDLSTQIPAIDADVTQMQQVIMNLVINASEAIDTNSGSISISTGVMRVDQHYLTTTFLDESLAQGQYVYLEVSDTGCGMNAETQKRIFEPFFTTKFTGRGLGMAAILGIVRGHSGAIKVYSEENKGSTFKLLFPCSEQKAQSLTGSEVEYAPFQSSGCVLVVDDEETIREVAVSMLKDLGLTSLLAADGIEAIEMYKNNQNTIDVVLLDMTMPRLGGEDTFSELCRINPNVKVILSSGYNEQDATNRFTGKGLAGFLQKPYTPKQLSEKLADIFDKT